MDRSPTEWCCPWVHCVWKVTWYIAGTDQIDKAKADISLQNPPCLIASGTESHCLRMRRVFWCFLFPAIDAGQRHSAASFFCNNRFSITSSHLKKSVTRLWTGPGSWKSHRFLHLDSSPIRAFRSSCDVTKINYSFLHLVCSVSVKVCRVKHGSLVFSAINCYCIYKLNRKWHL